MNLGELALLISAKPRMICIDYLGLILTVPIEYADGYIALDAEGGLYAYTQKPVIEGTNNFWSLSNDDKYHEYLGLLNIHANLDIWGQVEETPSLPWESSLLKISDIRVELPNGQ